MSLRTVGEVVGIVRPKERRLHPDEPPPPAPEPNTPPPFAETSTQDAEAQEAQAEEARRIRARRRRSGIVSSSPSALISQSVLGQ